VLLSPLMLVLAINGLFLGILLLPVFPLLAFGWLAAGGIRRAEAGAVRAVQAGPVARAVASTWKGAALSEPVAAPVAVAAADAALAPVRIRVAAARGTCPVGYRYEAGTEYVFRDGEVSPDFCPVARRALMPLVAQMRRGEIPRTLKPFCKTSVHEVVFEFAAGAPAKREVEPALE
jgi:uncharacterized repeat protein (TIGR04076 family)